MEIAWADVPRPRWIMIAGRLNGASRHGHHGAAAAARRQGEDAWRRNQNPLEWCGREETAHPAVWL
jgi:hypothetical protein